MSDYKKRMIEEYEELAERFINLSRMIEKYNSGTLEFELAYPSELLEDQFCAMRLYLNILVQRATLEGLDLDSIEVKIKEMD